MAEQAQIGVTGLAVMGRNLARNFARHGHRVAIHNRTYAKTEVAGGRGRHKGKFVPSEAMADFVASLERPRRVLIMVKAGPGRMRSSRSWCRCWRRATSSSTPATPTSRTRSGARTISARRAALRRRRRLRRRGGRAQRAVDHARRVAGVLRIARSAAGVHLGQGRRDAVLHLRRSRRRRALREDGAQRHRVRRHAADRRGVRPDPAGHRGQRGRDRRDLPPGTRATWSRS